MARQIYVNLPVRNLAKSRSFFASLGFGFEPRLTDDKAACLIVDDNIYVMLLADDFFSTFTDKRLCDANRNAEVMLCLSCNSRREVDELVARAVEAGGSIPQEPQNHGAAYGHAFEDPDGHIWELVCMEPGARVT